MQRLNEQMIQAALSAAVKRVMPSRPAVKTTVAVDGTGLASGAISTFFVKRIKDRAPGFDWRHWLKGLIVVDLDRPMIVAQTARRGPSNDCATLQPLVDQANPIVSIQTVLADAEFDSERNHQHVRSQLHAQSIIPAKRGKASWQIRGIRQQMRTHFPKRAYRRRALIESVISVVKRKLSSRAPGRTTDRQRLQALLLGLAYDVYRV